MLAMSRTEIKCVWLSGGYCFHLYVINLNKKTINYLPGLGVLGGGVGLKYRISSSSHIFSISTEIKKKFDAQSLPFSKAILYIFK